MTIICTFCKAEVENIDTATIIITPQFRVEPDRIIFCSLGCLVKWIKDAIKGG